MNSQELHAHGLIDTRGAIVAALIDDGWSQGEADRLVADFLADNPAPRKWKRWTAEEMAAVDAVIEQADGRLPGVADTRPLAERLGRPHKSLLSQIERRIDVLSRVAADS
jgi:hypothetical protein